jgi:fructokinase
MSAPRFGAIEAGGTKFVLAVGTAPDQLEDIRRVSTSHNPLETIAEVVRYFERHPGLAALGVASFGPVDHRSGSIANTPKAGWKHFPLRDALRRALHVPIGFETDVAAAALAEARIGAARGLSDSLYMTVGTGIGGGVIVNGAPVQGLVHPEIGHLLVRRAPGERDGFAGICPYHGGCLEGMASGPALHARWGCPGHELPENHEAWRIEADYLAQLCVNLACTVSPRMIILGGGVMAQQHLYELTRARAEEYMNGYVELPPIAAPALAYPGLAGALMLAQMAVQCEN